MRFGVFVVLFVLLQRFTGMLVAAVVIGLLMLRFVDRRPLTELGWPVGWSALPQFGLGTAIGAVALLAGALLMVLAGVLRFAPDGGTVLEWGAGMARMFGVLLLPAATEEALFRGYPYQKLVQGFGAPIATVAASAAFAIAHANNPSVNGLALANIFVAGIMLSAAFLLTRSLWFATGVHLGWNWAMAALLDLPVSGLELFDAPLYEPIDRGPAWVSGGAFGPEAGLAGFVGLGLALAGVVWITRKKARWVTSIE